MMEVYAEVLKDNVVETNDRSDANYIITDHANYYIMGKDPPKVVNWLDFYTYYIPKKEFDQSIFDNAYKMLMSNDLDSMKLGIDLLFFMERPQSTYELDISKIRRLFTSANTADISYHIKSLMIAHNYED